VEGRIDGGEIARGEDYVGVEHDKPLATGTFSPIVAALAGAAIVLIVIT